MVWEGLFHKVNKILTDQTSYGFFYGVGFETTLDEVEVLGKL